uniref:TGFBR3/Endoglin-like N-terminal domain-containing protein n=1 Tax=Astyanax mexicanus TaxID=7994 RepID=A0A3B1JWB3_ASTMX
TEDITVEDITEGCWTSFQTKDKKEVHIINLQISQPVRPLITMYGNVGQPESSLSLYVSTSLQFVAPPIPISPLKGSELVKWAKQEFGGVTSFTTVQDPINVKLTQTKGKTVRISINLQFTVFYFFFFFCWIPAQINGLNIPSRRNISDAVSNILQQVLFTYSGKSISSYTEIHLNSKMTNFHCPNIYGPDCTLSLLVSSVTEQASELSTTSPPSAMEMHLFTSSDYSSSLDPSTKVQPNKRIYAEVFSSVFSGEWVLTIRVKECSVHSKGLQPLVRKLPIKPESCRPTGCHNNARFSFSFDSLQDPPSNSNSWDLECNIIFCHDQGGVCTIIVTVCVCLHVAGYPAALGIGSTGTLLSGCPCTLNKRQPVPTNPSPSENSSANGSMGSTQSTPTSSMA